MRAGSGGRVAFGRPRGADLRAVADALRAETIGGALLLAAAAAALIWANSPASGGYARLRELSFGPAALHLHLSMEAWASEGLLAVFFFVAGLELKRELVEGEMRHASAALVPVAAALAGVAVPAACYLAVTGGHPAAAGWAIPCATDIAFALAVLAVTGRFLPGGLRAFLLTLAVVDDLCSIVIIAAAYSESVRAWPLIAAAAGLALFWLAQRRRTAPWWLTGPLAVLVWALVHASGVHATVAGIALGLAVPAASRHGRPSRAEYLEHVLRPVSAGLAVPAFALLSAGLAISWAALGEVFTARIGLGILAGLIAGKAAGVYGGAWCTARFTGARLSPGLDWADIFAAAVLAGVGFTVSLLISGLAFGPRQAAAAKTAVLAASLIASGLACVLLAVRNAHYRRLRAEEDAPRPG